MAAMLSVVCAAFDHDHDILRDYLGFSPQLAITGEFL
jgi:hypothetical protein